MLGVFMPNSLDPQIIRSTRKTLTLQILPDASLIIKAPLFISQKEINSFLKEHQSWIEKKRALLASHIKKDKQFREGEKYLFLGQEYLLKFGNYTSISINGEYLLFPQASVFRGEKELNSWYIKQAQKIIFEQVSHYGKLMDLSPSSISFSDTKSKWGSCTHDNRLQFNWRLIMAPILVINYVVVHELVHFTIKNHSSKFWDKVRHFNPSYRQQIKWLKKMGNALFV
jgi:predicted metal-dependent hydrolase